MNANKRWLVLAGLIYAAFATYADTGIWTNVNGGYWSETNNWQEGCVPYGITNIADFTALDSGKTILVTNYTPIGALLFSGASGDVWTLSTDTNAVMGIEQQADMGVIQVDGGTLNLEVPIQYAFKGIRKTGTGSLLMFGTNNYIRATHLNDGTLILTNGTALKNSAVIFHSTNTVLLLAGDALIGGLSSVKEPAPGIALNGHELQVGGSQQNLEWTGILTGDGTLAITGGEVQSLLTTQSCSGVVRVDNGILELGRPQGRSVAWWRFDDAQDIGKDSGAQGNDLVPNGTVSQVQDAERGGVLLLDNGAYLKGAGTGLDLTGLPVGNTPFTIAFWMKLDPDVNAQAVLFGWGTYNTTLTCNMMRLNLSDSASPLLYTNWANNRSVPSAADLKDGNWHHIAIVYTGRHFYFYIGGTLMLDIEQAAELNVKAGNFTLGKGWTANTFKGLIDDFVIADWALTPAQLETVRSHSEKPVKTADNILSDEIAFEVGFNGILRLNGEQTVATLSGAGAAGSVDLNAGSVFTAQGTDSSTSTVFYSAINGDGKFVKRGSAYTLTLGGASSYTGATEVAEGTLTLLKEELRCQPQAWYRFDDPANLGKDSSGNGYDLVAINTPFYHAFGQKGGAAGFNVGNQDRLHFAAGVPSSFPTGNSSYTLAVWCKPNEANTLGMPLYWGGNSLASFSASLFRFNDTSRLMFSNLGNNKLVDAGFNLFTNTLNNGWHHIASTYDSSTRQRKVYINGELKSTDTLNQDLNISDKLFQLGGAPYSAANYYDGLLDDVMIFNSALDVEQVTVVMTITASTPVPVACYRFEDILQPGFDSSGNGYDLAAFGAVTITDSGKRGRALDLTATTQSYLMSTNSVFPALLPTGNSAATFSMWVNPKTDADLEGATLFLGKHEQHMCHVIRLIRLGYNRPIGIRYTNALAALESDAVNQIDRGDGAEGWHHVAAVYNPIATSGNRKLYIDGVLVAQDNNKELNVGVDRFYIGRMEIPIAKWFQGMIDEVEIYNRALTQHEILTVIHNGADILPAATTLSVASGASVAMSGADQQISALTGAGEVDLGRSLGLGVLTVAGGSGIFEGSLTGFGGLVVRDGATQTLAGASTFIGPVIVSNAMLLVDNVIGSATGASNTVAVMEGGLLGGSGSIIGDIFVAEGGGFTADSSSTGVAVDGTITLPTAGVVTLTLPSGFIGAQITLISASALSAPSGFANWTVEGIASPFSSEIKRSGNTVKVSVFYKGSVIMIR